MFKSGINVLLSRILLYHIIYIYIYLYANNEQRLCIQYIHYKSNTRWMPTCVSCCLLIANTGKFVLAKISYSFTHYFDHNVSYVLQQTLIYRNDANTRTVWVYPIVTATWDCNNYKTRLCDFFSEKARLNIRRVLTSFLTQHKTCMYQTIASYK